MGCKHICILCRSTAYKWTVLKCQCIVGIFNVVMILNMYQFLPMNRTINKVSVTSIFTYRASSASSPPIAITVAAQTTNQEIGTRRESKTEYEEKLRLIQFMSKLQWKWRRQKIDNFKKYSKTHDVDISIIIIKVTIINLKRKEPVKLSKYNDWEIVVSRTWSWGQKLFRF